LQVLPAASRCACRARGSREQCGSLCPGLKRMRIRRAMPPSNDSRRRIISTSAAVPIPPWSTRAPLQVCSRGDS
jgi:hypothetical protein